MPILDDWSIWCRFLQCLPSNDRVRVYTRHNEESQTYLWESSAGGSFTVTPTPEVALTRVSINLKEDQGEFLEETRLRELVKTHSYINFPIELFTTRETDREVTDSEDSEEEDSPNYRDNRNHHRHYHRNN